MVRYLAIATVIVLGALSILLATPHGSSAPPRAARYAKDRASPRAGAPDVDVRTAEPVTGAAPWALSAVPECLRERAQYTGDEAFVRGRLPKDARLVAGPARLTVADCTIRVAGTAVSLERGDNRLAIPSPARLYVTGSGIALAQAAGSRERLRVYVLAPGAVRSPSRRP